MPSRQKPFSAAVFAPLESVLDALPVSLYVVDRQLRIVAWNTAREQGPLGRPRAKAIGRPLREVLSEAGFRATAPLLKRVFASGEPIEETTEAESHARQFRIRRFPIRVGREITHVLSWFEDITEQRALELRLIATDRLAFLGQLVAGVAHEVANPLASIAGCTEALASLAAESPSVNARADAREFHELIKHEVARCERILRSLLRSARPQPEAQTDLRETVEETLRLLERHPAFMRVKVVCRWAGGLPPARIDADSLRQVVIVLAINAARAMAGGGVLTLKGARNSKALVLDVLDTGPGVPLAIRNRIFEPFFTTDESRGTGLGLAIARNLVRGRGGDLVHRPRPTGGAAFRVLLPAARNAS
jgi:PAS domain S-box-containing protein